MKIALLILTHNLDVLKTLLSMLSIKFEVFVHLDSKVEVLEVPDFSIYAPNVHLMTERLPIYWGGWNMVQATLNLLRTARQQGRFSRYVLLSGDALPLLTASDLADVLFCQRTEFIDLFEQQKDRRLANITAAEARKLGAEHAWRFHNFVWRDHLLLSGSDHKIAQTYSTSKPELLRDEVNALIQSVLVKLPARQNIFQRLFSGSQWWALSGEAISIIADDLFSGKIRSFFENFEVPDEHVFHCLIGNYKSWFDETNRIIERSPMWTDHEARRAGNYYITLDCLRNTRERHGANLLFARKYDPVKCPDVAHSLESGSYLT